MRECDEANSLKISINFWLKEPFPFCYLNRAAPCLLYPLWCVLFKHCAQNESFRLSGIWAWPRAKSSQATTELRGREPWPSGYGENSHIWRFRKCLFEKTKIRTKTRPEMAHYKHNWVDISGLWYVVKISVVHWEQKFFLIG